MRREIKGEPGSLNPLFDRARVTSSLEKCFG
jgi:hypothetical protein